MQPSIVILDPTGNDRLSAFRGGGRYVQMAREALGNTVRFVSDLSEVQKDDTLIVPFWFPFQKPLLTKRICTRQFLIIFDVIPLKYPNHFPIGLKGHMNLFLNKRSLSVYDGLITISEHAKRDIQGLLPIGNKPIHLLSPYTIDVLKKKDSGQLTIDNKKLPSKYLLYVADVNWNKNLPTIARAIKLAGVPCVFAGKVFEARNQAEALASTNAWLASYKEFLKEVGDDDRFIFPGYVSDGQLASLYQHATANILVSHDEGFGMSYIEAGSNHCPSILSDTPIFHEIAESAVLFADANNQHDIAEKIKELWNDEKLRNSLARKALIQSQTFSKERFKREFRNLLLN